MAKFTDEEREQIMQESRDTLERLATFEPNELAWAMAQPVEDPLDRWRREAELFEARRERAQAEIREPALEARLMRYVDQCMATLRAEIASAITEERSLMEEIIGCWSVQFKDEIIAEVTKANVVPLRSHDNRKNGA